MANTARSTDAVPAKYALLTVDMDYNPPLRGFRTALTGNVSVVRLDGTTVVIPGLVAGETFRGMIKRVNGTNTTVISPTTNIVVFW